MRSRQVPAGTDPRPGQSDTTSNLPRMAGISIFMRFRAKTKPDRKMRERKIGLMAWINLCSSLTATNNMKKEKMMLKRLIKIAGLSAAALTLFLWSRPANVGAQSDVRLCPADRPCIKQLYQSGATLVISWDGLGNYDHYNFRWTRPGKAETQSEVRGGDGGSFRINNVNPDTRYTVKVQGCNSSFLGRSRCTPWYEDSIVTRTNLHHGPDTC